MEKVIYIVGVGGRTGSMFARELQGTADVMGVGMKEEVERLAAGKTIIERGGIAGEILKTEAIAVDDFARAVQEKVPDFILLAVRNPVGQTVQFYYRNFAGKDNFPVLILSQNGLSAINDAKIALRAVLGQDADKVLIARLSMINGVGARFGDGTFNINYKLPIKIGIGILGDSDSARQAGRDLTEIFWAAGFKAQEFNGKKVFEMENSKLFTNLIGMVAAVEGMAAGPGLRDKKVFCREVMMLREYILAVRKSGGGFAAFFCGYPIGLLANIMLLPMWLLIPFRGILARIVTKGRNRPKDLGEIDYYNGEAVRLGKRFGIVTSVNEEILRKAKQIR